MTDHRMLTPQILAMYLGCQVRTIAGNNYELVGVVNGDEIVTCYLRNSTGLIGNCHIEDIKPILRTLSDMTDEEKDELTPHQIACIETGHLSMLNFTSETFLYLLSRGFDLFNLIDSGLAIELKPKNL